MSQLWLFLCLLHAVPGKFLGKHPRPSTHRSRQLNPLNPACPACRATVLQARPTTGFSKPAPSHTAQQTHSCLQHPLLQLQQPVARSAAPGLLLNAPKAAPTHQEARLEGPAHITQKQHTANLRHSHTLTMRGSGILPVTVAAGNLQCPVC